MVLVGKSKRRENVYLCVYDRGTSSLACGEMNMRWLIPLLHKPLPSGSSAFCFSLLAVVVPNSIHGTLQGHTLCRFHAKVRLTIGTFQVRVL